jgi:nucleoside-diphosphate-sugar epimerase
VSPQTHPHTDDTADARHVVLGAGPVGRAIIAELARLGITSTVVTRSGTSVAGAAAVRADVTDPRQLASAIAGATVVHQCAQPEYHRWPQEFPALQSAVVDAVAATGALLVVVENLYGYGPVDAALTETLPLHADTRKGAVRARMHLDLLEAHQAGRIRMVVARASDFFGPHVEGSVFGERFVSQVAAGRKVDVLGDPDALHSVTYVPDLAAAMVRLSTEPTIRRVPRWQLRAIGMFVVPMREMVEMADEFEHDFVVDHGDYAARFGDHATPLDDALAATFAATRTTDVGSVA